MRQERYSNWYKAMGFKTYPDYLASPLWIEKRKSKLKQNPYCEICGRKAIIAHHKNYENVGNERGRDLLSVCRICHEKIHSKKK